MLDVMVYRANDVSGSEMNGEFQRENVKEKLADIGGEKIMAIKQRLLWTFKKSFGSIIFSTLESMN